MYEAVGTAVPGCPKRGDVGIAPYNKLGNLCVVWLREAVSQPSLLRARRVNKQPGGLFVAKAGSKLCLATRAGGCLQAQRSRLRGQLRYKLRKTALMDILAGVTITNGDNMEKTYNRANLQRARSLRKKMTPWEYKLWYKFLRDMPCHFRRQRPMGRYIVDFYSASARLIIELDGSGHYEPKQLEYDNKRTEELASLGLVVFRMQNLEVDKNFTGVCETIMFVVDCMQSMYPTKFNRKRCT